MEQGSTISAQFHRELNRLLDSDRNTRKKGLQKLYESLPWERKETRPQLVKFVEESIIEVILSANILADPIEKCREYALKLLVSYTAQLKKPSGKAASQLGDTAVRQLLVSLMARIETTPFPESAEELRLLVVELLTSLCLHFEPALSSEGCRDVRERMVLTMSRAVCDAFPAVKRSAAELLTLLAGLPMFLPAVKSHTTTILKSLATNVNHQHSKTRLSTLTAMMFIVKVAAGVDESFVHALRSDLSIGNTPTSTSATSHSFYGIMSRALSDRTPLVRKELSSLLAKHLVKPRLLVVGDSFSSQLRRSLSEDDCEIIVLLVLLSGDDIDEVADAATTAIINTFNKHWTPEHSASSSSGAAYEPNLIDDNAELSLRSLPSSSSGHPAIAESAKDALHGGNGILRWFHASLFALDATLMFPAFCVALRLFVCLFVCFAVKQDAFHSLMSFRRIISRYYHFPSKRNCGESYLVPRPKRDQAVDNGYSFHVWFLCRLELHFHRVCVSLILCRRETAGPARDICLAEAHRPLRVLLLYRCIHGGASDCIDASAETVAHPANHDAARRR